MTFKPFMIATTFALLGSSAFAGDFTLTSPDVSEGKPLGINQVFDGFGCKGKNHSPAIAWSGAPKDTRAFALTVYDPDAPTGSGWWHWVAFNIPATAASLPENAGTASGESLPKGTVQANSDYGKKGFGGACPPAGDAPHHYHFTVTALKDVIPLKSDASAAMVGYYIRQLSLGEATLTATYQRSK